MKTAKTVITALGAITTVAIAAFADDVVNADEAGTIAACVVTQVITVIAVYGVRNKGYIHDPQAYAAIHDR